MNKRWSVAALWDAESYQIGYKVVWHRSDGREEVVQKFRLAGDVRLCLSSSGASCRVIESAENGGHVVLDGYYARKLGGVVATACARQAEDWAEYHLEQEETP